MFFSRLKRKSDKAPPGESRLPFPPRGAGPAARPKQRSHPLAGRRGPPQRPWGPRGRQQRGFLELARVLESRVAARGQLSALLLAASLSAAGRTEFWGAPQHCGTSWLSDVYTMPALRQAKEKKMWQGIFFSFVLLFVVVWGFFFFFPHTLPLSPVVPRSSSLPQNIIAIIISRLISLSKRCNGASRPSQRHPQNKRRAIRGVYTGLGDAVETA